MSYEKSPIDEFFYNLYGFYPEKAGQAYELLVNAALKIVNKNSELKYNQFKEGTYSQQKYQLDGIKDDKESIEAKDYTIRNEKVGRPDIQKQEGGLIDLPYDGGIFASATGYTRNAEKYAEGTHKNPNTKPIVLYNIRPSTEADEEGRVKTVILHFTVVYPDFNKGIFEPVFTKDAQEQLLSKYPDGKINCLLQYVYNDDRTIYLKVSDWTQSLNSQVKSDVEQTTINGETSFTNKFILIEDELYEITKIKYSIPIIRSTDELRVEQDGNACLLVKNSDGTTDTLLTDAQLKDIGFNEGNVINNGGTR